MNPTTGAASSVDPEFDKSLSFWEDLEVDGQTAGLMYELLRARQLVVAAIESRLKPYGLSMTRYLALVTIMQSEDGARRLSQLSGLIMVLPTSITVIADQLEKAGLIQRKADATDRRAVLAVITPAGRALVREASRALDEAHFGLPSLNPQKTARLFTMLAEVANTLDADDRPNS